MPKFLGKSKNADLFINKKGEIVPYFLAKPEDVKETAEGVLPIKGKPDDEFGGKVISHGPIHDMIMHLESRGRDFDKEGKLLKSYKGSMGRMQVMPATAKDPGFGIKPAKDESPEELARVGNEYVTALTREFGGDTEKILSAYNAGPNRVKSLIEKHGDSWKNHLPDETKTYLKLANKYQALRGIKENTMPVGDYDYKQAQIDAINKIKAMGGETSLPSTTEAPKAPSVGFRPGRAGYDYADPEEITQQKVEQQAQFQPQQQMVTGAPGIEQPGPGMATELPQKQAMPAVTSEPIDVNIQEPMQDPYGIHAGKAQYMGGIEQESKAKQEQAQALSDFAKVQQQIYDENLKKDSELQQLNQRHQRELENIQKSKEVAMRKYEDSVNHFAQMGNINPNRLWNNASTSDKVSAAIAIAAGGAVAGFFGSTQNQALDMFNKIIDRDIDAQKMALEKAGMLTGMHKNLYSMMRDQLQDEDLAYISVKSAMLKNIEMQLEGASMKANSTVMAKNIEVIRAQLQQQMGQFNVQFGQNLMLMDARRSLFSGGEINTGLLGILPDADRKEVLDRMVNVGGRKMLAYNSDTRKEIETRLPEQEKTLSLANNIKKYLDSGVFKKLNWASPEAAQVRSMVEQLRFSFVASLKNIGKLSETELGMVEKIISDPTKVNTWFNDSRIQTLINEIQADRQRMLRQGVMGYSPNIR